MERAEELGAWFACGNDEPAVLIFDSPRPAPLLWCRAFCFQFTPEIQRFAPSPRVSPLWDKRDAVVHYALSLTHG
jgi:hypothetical protein